MTIYQISKQPITTLIVITFLPIISMADSQGIYVTRDEIVQHLSPKINVHLRYKDVTEQQKQSIIESLELDKWAAEVLPERFELRKETHKDLILNSYNHIISYDHPEHIELGIKQTLMNVGLRCYACKLAPVLSEADSNKIEDELKRIANGVRNSFYRHLQGQFTKDEINKVVDEHILRNLIRKRDEPWGPNLKKPIHEEEVNRLLGVFDERLARTKHRAVERLEKFKSADHSGEINKSEALSKIKRNLLIEIIAPLKSAVHKSSRIKVEELESLGPGDFFPKYPEMSKRFNTLDNKLSREAFKAKVKENRMKSALAPVMNEEAIAKIIQSNFEETAVALEPNNMTPMEQQNQSQPNIVANTRVPKPSPESSPSKRTALIVSVLSVLVLAGTIALVSMWRYKSS